MRSSTIAPQPQRAVIRFPGPSVQVSRKTLEVLASALEDVRLFYGLSSLQVVARNETQRLFFAAKKWWRLPHPPITSCR